MQCPPGLTILIYMGKKILVVEDEFIVANDLRLMLERAGYQVCGIASSVEEAREIISQENPHLVLLDIYLKGKLTGIDLAKQLSRENIAFVYLSANSNQRVLEEAKATQPYGFLVKPFREKDVLVTLDIARYRHENSLESRLRQEVLLKNMLENIIGEYIGWEQKLLKIARAIQPYVPFDYIGAVMKNTDVYPYNGLGFLRIGFDEYQMIGVKEFLTITGLKLPELTKLQAASPEDKVPAWYNENDFTTLCQQHPLRKLIAHTFQLASNLVIPLKVSNGEAFTFYFYSRRQDAYTAEHLALLSHLQPSLTQLINNILATEKIGVPSESFQKDLPTSVENLPVHTNFEGIIGKSHLLLRVLDHISQVAPLDTSVLILGESGTGKEKIAHVIHHLSPHKLKPLVKVNCAALPANLIESELFGHEKGAFTGALDKRIGKFEQAAGGTIFLDEIGEMPIEMQVKLLRVLQEKEIERIGGNAPIKIDVRIVAATNRNLEKEVAEGRFRLDLYYRLNVFPVTLPPLRERKEDLQLLAQYFATNFSSKFNKPFHGISSTMMAALETYEWPGNIRELENIMEQSVILNNGRSELELMRPLSNAIFINVNATDGTTQHAPVSSLNEVKQIQLQTEREYLITVLKKANGRIRGEGGAAELLNIKPTTLESRMAKLGIKKEDFL